jgi:hypothetical protein
MPQKQHKSTVTQLLVLMRVEAGLFKNVANAAKGSSALTIVPFN